jgi:hypothetical protein
MCFFHPPLPRPNCWRQPLFQCHQLYQTDATNVNESAINIIVVLATRDCNGVQECQGSRGLVFGRVPSSKIRGAYRYRADSLLDPSIGGHAQER